MGLLNTIDANFDVIALSETGRKNIENREAQLKTLWVQNAGSQTYTNKRWGSTDL